MYPAYSAASEYNSSPFAEPHSPPVRVRSLLTEREYSAPTSAIAPSDVGLTPPLRRSSCLSPSRASSLRKVQHQQRQRHRQQHAPLGESTLLLRRPTCSLRLPLYLYVLLYFYLSLFFSSSLDRQLAPSFDVPATIAAPVSAE